MDFMERYTFELRDIQDDLSILIQNHVYEIDKRPGNPCVSTVGKRLVVKLNDLLNKIEQDKPGKMEEMERYFKEM